MAIKSILCDQFLIQILFSFQNFSNKIFTKKFIYQISNLMSAILGRVFLHLKNFNLLSCSIF